MIGMPNINQYFKVAMGYPVEKLQAVMRGQDKSIPMLAAMAAFEIKGPMEIAAKAQQAAQKQSTVSVREKLANEGEEERNGMLPDSLMMAMQQQQQGSLPENTGIGRLPAPNMQTMSAANGGIVAFDDGGYVPGYAGSDLFARSDVDEEELAALDADQVLTPGRGRGAPPKSGMPDKTRKFLENKDKDKGKTKGRAGVPIKDTNILDELIGAPTPSPNRPNGRAPEAPALPQSDVDRLIKANRDMNAMPRAEASSAPPTEKRTASATSSTSAAPQLSTEQQMADVMSRISGTQDAEIKSQYADLEKKTATGIEALRRTREQGKPTGQAYSGLEASLKKDEEAVKGKEDRNLQMALVNAGLAIAGGTSRYAMENIGKGALVGTKQYMDGLDKLEVAAKERQKMSAMIEEARRAEARGDFKEKNEFETRGFELGVNSRKTSIEGLAKIYDKNTKAATDIFNNLETQRHADIRNRETNATTREVYKNRAGGGEYNVLADNARARYAAWAKSPAGELALVKDPGLEARKYVEFLREEYATRGLPLPSNLTGGATMPSGAGLKFLGFEKQ